MAAYATQAEFEAYVEGAVVVDPAALARLLERASRDIDRFFAPRGLIGSGTYAGFRWDPTKLTEGYRSALSDATCAQAEYRGAVGETSWAEWGVGGRVTGPDFSYELPAGGRGGIPRIGPKALAELERLGALRTASARARP